MASGLYGFYYERRRGGGAKGAKMKKNYILFNKMFKIYQSTTFSSIYVDELHFTTQFTNIEKMHKIINQLTL